MCCLFPLSVRLRCCISLDVFFQFQLLNFCLQLFTWGCNDEGALGRMTSSDDGDEYLPGSVMLPSTLKIVQASAGDSHSAVLLEDGRVYAWGTFRVCHNCFYIGILICFLMYYLQMFCFLHLMCIVHFPCLHFSVNLYFYTPLF